MLQNGEFAVTLARITLSSEALHAGDYVRSERDQIVDFVRRWSAEFLGECDEKPLRPADVAEPIRVFILDYFAYELRAAIAEPFKCLVDVVHGEHDAEVA